VAEVPDQAGVPGEDSGRHLRHGLKPASAAAAAVGKNSTLPIFGDFTGQTGRQ
jgi:hypothetical protein